MTIVTKNNLARFSSEIFLKPHPIIPLVITSRPKEVRCYKSALQLNYVTNNLKFGQTMPLDIAAHVRISANISSLGRILLYFKENSMVYCSSLHLQVQVRKISRSLQRHALPAYHVPLSFRNQPAATLSVIMHGKADKTIRPTRSVEQKAADSLITWCVLCRVARLAHFRPEKTNLTYFELLVVGFWRLAYFRKLAYFWHISRNFGCKHLFVMCQTRFGIFGIFSVTVTGDITWAMDKKPRLETISWLANTAK